MLREVMPAWKHFNLTGMEFLLELSLKSSNGVIGLSKKCWDSLVLWWCKLHSLDFLWSGFKVYLTPIINWTGPELLPTEFKVTLEWLETTPDALQTSMFLSVKPWNQITNSLVILSSISIASVPLRTSMLRSSTGTWVQDGYTPFGLLVHSSNLSTKLHLSQCLSSPWCSNLIFPS